MSPAAGRGPGARRALGALLPVLLLVAGTYAFWEMRLSTRTDGYVLLVSSDLYNYFLPSYRYEAERLAAGAFPLWNPLQGVGQPFLATLQPGVLYPARLLLLVLTPLRALEVSLLAHVLLLVVSAYLLARALGASRLAASGAAWVAGTTIGGSWFYWPSYLEPAAWWPLLALALLRCIGGAGWRWPVLLGVAGAMPVLAGGYQVTLYMAYTLAILGAGLLADARFRPASWRGAAVRLAVAATIAVATAAPQLLPTLAWSGEAARRAAQVSDLQLDPLDLQPSPWAVVEHTLVSNGGVLPHYLSLPAAALALLGFARQRALGAVLGAGALLLFGIALGPGSPLFPLYRILPGLAMYRLPVRMLGAVCFVCSLGVAFGLDACRGWRRARSPRLGPAAAGAALALLLPALWLPIRNQTQLPWLQPGPLADALPLLRMAAAHARDGRAAFVGPWGLSMPRWAMLGDMPCVQDYEPLSSRRLEHYLHAMAGLPLPGADAPMAFMGHIREANPLALPRLLDMVAGQVVIVRPPAEAPPGLRPVGAYGESTVYTNPSALPRAYTVGSARFVATEAAALDAIQAPGFDPRREVVLVGTAEDGLAPEAAGAEGPGAARIVRDEVERIEIEVGPTAPAVLVLADAFAPGWQAFVDGSPRRLWQANHLLRGVLVRPGDERVRFVYEPPGWRLGWAVCGGGWLVAALALAVARSSG